MTQADGRTGDVVSPAGTASSASQAADGHARDSQDGDAGHRAAQTAIDELGAYIRAQRESARLSLRKLAKIAGVSNPYLSQIERGLRKPSAEILQAIAKALEISSETLYVKAGILEERDHHVDVEAAIAHDPALSDTQRQALVEMYRSLRALSAYRREGGDPRPGFLDAVRTGDVDDDDLRAVSLSQEDDAV